MKIVAKGVNMTMVGGKEIVFDGMGIAEVDDAVGKELLARSGGIYNKLGERQVTNYAVPNGQKLDLVYLDNMIDKFVMDRQTLPIVVNWMRKKLSDMEIWLQEYQQSLSKSIINPAPADAKAVVPFTEDFTAMETGAEGTGGEPVLSVDGISDNSEQHPMSSTPVANVVDRAEGLLKNRDARLVKKQFKKLIKKVV